MAKNLMICDNSKSRLKLNESEATSTGRYILEGSFATLGETNRNGRIYTKDEYLKHLQYLRNDIKSGEPLLGELDHPDDRFEVKLKEASHRVLDLWYDKDTNTIQGKIELLNTPNGKLAQSLVDQGIPLHISSRAAGSVNSDNTVSIQQIYTYDLVAKPGFASAVLHRVNESVDANKYTEDVNAFLNESNRMESKNAAGQYGFRGNEISIMEIASDVNLRREAKELKEIGMDLNYSRIVEDDEEKDDVEMKDGEDGKEDSGVKILSVKAETKSGTEIKSVEGDFEDEDSDDSEEGEEEKNECDKTVECGDSARKPSDDAESEIEKKATDANKLFDCNNIEDRKSKIEGKLDDILASIKKKNECAAAKNESAMIQYPCSMYMNESNFAEFSSLSESQKSKVIAYLRDNKITDARMINESWRNGVNYNEDEPVWIKYAPENYRKLYESASDAVKKSLGFTASFVLFENQHDVNTFWENSGLMESEARREANANFINNMPKIVHIDESESLPYGVDFINAVTEMACEYN